MTDTTERHVEMMRLSEMVPNPDNVKEHETGGVRGSIELLGLIDLPVMDERTGMLVAGHGRIEAITEAHVKGGEPPEGVEVADDGEWLVPVVRGWASHDDEEAAAAAIALNAWVAKGGWDNEGLTGVLQRLKEIDAALLVVTGYTERNLTDLLKGTEQWESDRGGAGSARREDSIDELAANYRNKQVRTLVLDYPLTEYRKVIDLANVARKRYGTEGNAELFMALVRRWDQAHPAD